MEREIKFRAKDCETGEWLYGSLIQRIGYFPSILHPIATDDGKIRYIETCVDKETICQYTGLKDKNGKEIYEGDIIRSFDSNGDAILHCIVWEEARFVALYKGRYFRSKCFLKQDWLDEFDKEVVDNIHDNQELFKDGRD